MEYPITSGIKGQIIVSSMPPIATRNIMSSAAISTRNRVVKPTSRDIKLSTDALILSSNDLPPILPIFFQGANKVFIKIGTEYVRLILAVN
jgi:hypothetical protein